MEVNIASGLPGFTIVDLPDTAVQEARERQRQRFGELPMSSNADMGSVEVWGFCRVEQAAQALVQAAMQQLHLSARAFHCILKLSRTIADLADSEAIQAAHLAESLQYRARVQV